MSTAIVVAKPYPLPLLMSAEMLCFFCGAACAVCRRATAIRTATMESESLIACCVVIP